MEGALRTLTRGYTQWASGRIDYMEVNTRNPNFCHIRSNMRPSMKPGLYKVYTFYGRKSEVRRSSYV